MDRMERPLATHARTPSASYGDGKEPHALSLKVLRLTRPSLSTQHTLPPTSPTSTLPHSLPRSASLAYPSAPSTPFTLSPLLTLPPEFGNAYVGETFSCTLCANNELLPTDLATPLQRIHGVKIEAEMKTPTTVVPVPVTFASSSPSNVSTSTSAASSRPPSALSTHDDPLRSSSPSPKTGDKPPPTDVELSPGQSLQGIITHHLREDGPHVLAVTISYTSSTSTSGRVRSFRKLYQFVATPALVVRTKIGVVGRPMERGAGIKASGGGARDSVISQASQVPERRNREGREGREGWALEAQLENVAEEGVVLESVEFVTDEWCRATSLTSLWSDQSQNLARVTDGKGEGEREKQVLSRGGVHQSCFFVEKREGKEVDAKSYMGVLNIRWRGPMGNVGELRTGWLGLRR